MSEKINMAKISTKELSETLESGQKKLIRAILIF